MTTRRLVLLGATGSVGRSTLDVVREQADRVVVHALSAFGDLDSLVALCREFRPAHAVIGDAAKEGDLVKQLRAAGLPTQGHAGTAALEAIAADPAAETVMAAIVGAAGLAPVLAAVKAGKRVLIANKEPLVMAGRLLLAEAGRADATLVPIDSEHNAIFQCLPDGFRCGRQAPGVRRLVLTASGGPFRDTPLADLRRVTPKQAVAHPNWVMGPKISVDSATMMNKGLELIEAQLLFDMPDERIDVLLHPQSVVHSMVEYVDGSTLAQLGNPDMRVPIAHALALPERWESGVRGLSVEDLSRLDFGRVDSQRFPALGVCRAALKAGGAMPNVLNAANEVAVDAFLSGRLGYTQITELIQDTLDAASRESLPKGDGLADVLGVDKWARARATEALAAPTGFANHG